MEYRMITLSTPASGVRVVMFSRPQAANAVNQLMSEELSHFFHTLPSEVRAVVLTGAGEKAFSAGVDLKERLGMDAPAWEAHHAHLRAARDAVLNCEIPVIAAVNGVAMGGGLELALAADFIYASPQARFALSEVSLGLIPGMGGMQLLPRAIPPRLAREWILTGARVSAEEAHRAGLVNRIVEADKLLSEAIHTAERLANGAPLAIRAAKAAMRAGEGLPLAEALAIERPYYQKIVATHDRVEGINAFNEKRKPTFTGA